MAIEIRNIEPRDLDAVLVLNEAAVPHVNSVPPAQLEEFREHAAYFRVALVDQAVNAYLIGLTPEARYDSPNFRWFCENYAEFAYIDRIAVADRARRLGLGSALYRDFETYFSGRAPRLACEVNLQPPNLPSMAFHRRHGFVRVGSQRLAGGDKEVAMLVKELGSWK